MVTLSSNPRPSAAEYEFIRQLVYKHSRIHLGAEKREMVGQRLHRRLQDIGLSSFEEYCGVLQSPDGEEELKDLIDVISTNAASFFQEGQHFKFLAHTALPQWVAAPHRRPGDIFRVWSAGCSSGEEPYSAAIVLADFFARHTKFGGQVVASDISPHHLQRAQAGIYQIEQVKLPEVEWLKRYFLKGVGAYQGCCRVKEDLKKLVAFHHANLFQPECPVAEPADVIFCRNVMIYFDRATQAELVQQLSRKLTPGGYLLVGLSESLPGAPRSFTSICPGVHRLQGPVGQETAPSLAYA